MLCESPSLILTDVLLRCQGIQLSLCIRHCGVACTLTVASEGLISGIGDPPVLFSVGLGVLAAASK